MKKKDLIVLSAAAVLILGSFVFIYFMFFAPKTKTGAATIKSVVDKQSTITGVFDDATLSKISGLKNYVSTNLDNIGRTNPFGPLE